ncbi:MAG TPA: class I SAM-dependent methyltransferase [Acholeplasmataceae bacterium]|nr:class I SAM-dependent methyltransferase [Acholeplasmataceae bacterium]
MKKYQEINAKMFDKWVKEGWHWGIPISHEVYKAAKLGNFKMYLTPKKPVPESWFPNLKGKKVLGLASGGGQQMPIFQALGAIVTCLDYSDMQLENEKLVANREGYEIELVKADMTKKLPFPDEIFDYIFHPVSNVYIEKVEPVFKECYRILKKGGILVSGLDNGFNFAFDSEDGKIMFPLPFNPLEDEEQYEFMVENDYGIQFSHTLEEQIGGQLKAGFILVDLYEDTNDSGLLHDFNIPTFTATKAVKK